MTHEETLANVQVAHLFLKAADQGIIARNQAATALRELFPGYLAASNEPLTTAVRQLLEAAANDAALARYSLNVRTAITKLRDLVPPAVLKLPDGITDEEAQRLRDEWMKSHTP